MSEEIPQREQDLKMVRQHLDQLGEHFDAVQIFCTRYNPNKVEGCDEDGSTTRVNIGTGNWFTRYGHVMYWLELVKEEARKDANEGN